MTQVKELLEQVLGLEKENDKVLNEKISGLEATVQQLTTKISDFEAQDVLDQAKAAELTSIKETLTTRLDELKAVDFQPVTDGLAEIITEAPGDTPEAIKSDEAIGTGKTTSDEAIEAIPEAIAELVAESEDA